MQAARALAKLRKLRLLKLKSYQSLTNATIIRNIAPTRLINRWILEKVEWVDEQRCGCKDGEMQPLTINISNKERYRWYLGCNW